MGGISHTTIQLFTVGHGSFFSGIFIHHFIKEVNVPAPTVKMILALNQKKPTNPKIAGKFLRTCLGNILTYGAMKLVSAR